MQQCIEYMYIYFILDSFVYLDNFGVISDYYQLLDVSISNRVGLWCHGNPETASNDVIWMLPDGTQMSSQRTTNSSGLFVTVCLQSLGLFSVIRQEMLSGVYTCIVPFQDGHTERHYVWIVKGKHITC